MLGLVRYQYTTFYTPSSIQRIIRIGSTKRRDRMRTDTACKYTGKTADKFKDKAKESTVRENTRLDEQQVY